ncbi:hypothetical protein GA0074692_6609 [Micromonospora pallida]|uniref:Uncharacterized protein n=1 Tax=Micromonospora pallida TaxID=145854 RepID=A0A1C6TJW1_9ACTN|nr:hypothetical protein GA0074692_6609 [Micromonospora pallida]
MRPWLRKAPRRLRRWVTPGRRVTLLRSRRRVAALVASGRVAGCGEVPARRRVVGRPAETRRLVAHGGWFRSGVAFRRRVVARRPVLLRRRLVCPCRPVPRRRLVRRGRPVPRGWLVRGCRPVLRRRLVRGCRPVRGGWFVRRCGEVLRRGLSRGLPGQRGGGLAGRRRGSGRGERHGRLRRVPAGVARVGRARRFSHAGHGRGSGQLVTSGTSAGSPGRTHPPVERVPSAGRHRSSRPRGGPT